MRPVRTLPTGWEGEIQRILNSVGEDWRGDSPTEALSRSTNVVESVSVEEEEEQRRSQVAVQALKLGFQLALKERDAIIRQYEELGNVLERSKQFQMRPEDSLSRSMMANGTSDPFFSHPDALMSSQLENLSMSSPKLNNKESELNSTRHGIGSLMGDTSKPVPSPKFHNTYAMSEMFTEPVEEEGEEQTTWEYHSVTLARITGYGFGIAVSGGRDNPHFKNGDPSIVVSDVLRAGPAWGQLMINDRIVSANGISLESADYSTAVQIMKESDQLNMIVKRRVPLPALEVEQRTLKFTLTKSRRKDDFGVQLGCRFFIRDITNPKLAEKEPGLKEGDVVLKINGQNCEEMGFEDARRLLAKSKERLSLVIQRDVPKGTTWKWPSQQTLYERLGSIADTPRDSPRASPMPAHRYSDSENQYRLNNTLRTSGRYGRMTASELGLTSPKRYSYGQGSQPPSRSRTPSHSLYDDYGNYAPPRPLPPQTPPRAVTPGEEDQAHMGSANAIDPSSPLAQKPPLPLALPEPRQVSFRKESGSVGVRVIGGNEVGIFVSAVQAASPAANKGVRPGDKILKVNTKDMKGVTREEAVLFLLGLPDQVDLQLQYRKDEYERIRTQNLGDNFYIRVHFDYVKAENEAELTFHRGDIFQITDTLFGGTVGSWQATRVSSPSSDGSNYQTTQTKGVIPNSQRAEKLAQTSDSFRMSRSQTSETKSGTFLRRKMGLTRRAKSLTKGHWDEVVFSQGTVEFPAYERVKLKHPGFLRPVVLFGGLSDVARDLLLRDFPLRFSVPSDGTSSPTSSDKSPSSGIVRLSAIKDVMGKNKHCVLDVTPSSVEKLQYAQYSPIVIYLHVENRARLKELRSKHNKAAGKSTKKLAEQAIRIQKHYQHLFSASLDATKEDQWFEALRELISHLQERRVWMSETRPADMMEDDFLFPMGNSRYSTYVHDSDVESLKGESELGMSATPSASHRPTVSTEASTSYEEDNRGFPANNFTNFKYNPDMSVPVSRGPPHNAYPASSHPQQMDPYGSYLPPNSRIHNFHSVAARSMYMPDGDVYANREALISHIATIRRVPQQQRPRIKPKPPPRLNTSCPPVPPKPRLLPPSLKPRPDTPQKDTKQNSIYQNLEFSSPVNSPSKTPIPPTNGTAEIKEGHSLDDTTSDNVFLENDVQDSPQPPQSTATTLTTARAVPVVTCGGDSEGLPSTSSGPPIPSARPPNYNRHVSEPGYYDVKQILAEQSEDYRRRTPSPPSNYLPQPPSPYYRPPQPPTPNRHTQHPNYDHLGRPVYSPAQRQYSGPTGMMVRPRGIPPGPVRLMNPAFMEADHRNANPYQQGVPINYPSSPYQVPSSLRTASMPAATGPQLRNGRPPPLPPSLAPSRSPVPPPAPAPRSPRTITQSPRLMRPFSEEHEPSPSTQSGTSHSNDISVIRIPSQETYGHQQLILPPPKRLTTENGDFRHQMDPTSPTANNAPSRHFPQTHGFLQQESELEKSTSPTHPSNTESNGLTNSSRSWPNGAGSEEGYGSSASSPSNKKPPVPQKPGSLSGSGLDLSARNEHGGSAFELYKKTEGGMMNGSASLESSEGTTSRTMESTDGDSKRGESLDEKEHTVVAHVCGVVTSEGGSLTSEDTGVSIHIPAGALPPDSIQEIYFKVCQDSQMAPPLDADRGETLLSPLVMCGPQGLKFMKPVELRLPHCASGINSEQWSFALKSATGAEAEWRQVTLADATGATNDNKGCLDEKFVSVLIDHF